MEENKEFDVEELKELQLEMLDEFIAICNKFNLRYYVVYGTCIGALRHQGFIPWDDDIDVGMPRSDYDEFIRIAQDNLPCHLFLQCAETEPDFRLEFAKIRNSNTTFIEKTAKNLKINHGIYIDIFPIDGLPKSKSARKRIKLRQSLDRTYLAKDYVFEKSSTSFKSRVKLFLCKFLGLFRFGKTPQKVLLKLQNLYRKYKYEDCEYSVCNAFGSDKERYLRSLYGNGSKAIFEGREVVVPERADEYLTITYGDWRQLPPEEERVGHHYHEVIDTKKSYKCYMGDEK